MCSNLLLKRRNWVIFCVLHTLNIHPQLVCHIRTPSGSPAPVLPKAKTNAVVGSEWNNAGTWEERDTTKQGTARLKELLAGLSWGAAKITKLNKVEGTASFGHSRRGNFFFFEYRLEMEVKVAHSSGSDYKFKLVKRVEGWVWSAEHSCRHPQPSSKIHVCRHVRSVVMDEMATLTLSHPI